MAVFTRINGDAYGVVNVDAGRNINANTYPINTGIAAPLTAYKITLAAGTPSGSYGNLAAELTTGGAVETLIRWIEGNASILAYQVDAGSAGAAQLSVLVERSGWASDTALATALQTGNGQWTAVTGGNIGATGNIWASSNSLTTVSSAGGIKLA
jgi:hypothetical protein